MELDGSYWHRIGYMTWRWNTPCRFLFGLFMHDFGKDLVILWMETTIHCFFVIWRDNRVTSQNDFISIFRVFGHIWEDKKRLDPLRLFRGPLAVRKLNRSLLNLCCGNHAGITLPLMIQSFIRSDPDRLYDFFLRLRLQGPTLLSRLCE